MRRLATLLAAFAASIIAALAHITSTASAAVTIESFAAEPSLSEAGAHADFTTSFSFRQVGEYVLGGEPSVVTVKLPPGVVGDAENVPTCPRTAFELSAVLRKPCASNTEVGEAIISFAGNTGPGTRFGVYNVEPAPDQPATLGIQGIVAGGFPVAILIAVSASAEDNYALVARTEVQYFPIDDRTAAATVRLWGDPEAARGAQPSNYKPFMENPTECGHALSSQLAVNTTEEPETLVETVATTPILTNCAAVPFAPLIRAESTTTQSGAPAGLNFTLTLPQTNDPSGPGTADLDGAVVTLPAGMTISPSAASQMLEGCTDEQFAAGSDAAAQCPAASVIGEDEVESPLVLSGPLKGKVYLGQPLSTEPQSGRMFRIFQELSGFGLHIKLQGAVAANPATGQLTATFSNLPELPFEDFRMKLRGGPNAVLVNPSTCGSHTSTATLTPYSAPEAPVATVSSSFTTSYGEGGGACPASLPFAPSASVATANPQAGAGSPFTVTFARGDGTQPLGQLAATLPRGLLGYVSEVPLCDPGAALAGTCGPESRIGTVSTSVGAGSDPLTVEGSVYLARGDDGYPFMLSVVVPAVAGPYDLGDVVVPVYLQVNSNGSVTATSGPLPSILDGIPLDIRSVTLSVDRPGFAINPTDCRPLSLTGTATSLAGMTVALSAPFQVTGCSDLAFKPSFGAATEGSTSKKDGASLTVRIAQQAGEAAISAVHVELPAALPSRLSTLNKACLAAVFNADPASCPRESVVGTAVVYTPLLRAPLSGPAIFVSNGGGEWPNLDLVLQGEGITVIIVGNTHISKGKVEVTSSTFASVPDVPISGFELTLPEGPYSALSDPNGSPCGQSLVMPTKITGQNGAVVEQKPKIAVSGCAAPQSKAKSMVKIKKAKLKAKDAAVLVTVKAVSRGLVTFSGKGLRMVKKYLKAGTSRVTVPLAQAGKALNLSNRRLEVRARLVVGKQTVATTARVWP